MGEYLIIMTNPRAKMTRDDTLRISVGARAMNEQSTAGERAPLCVDLDETLLRTDLLIESWFGLLRHNALRALLAPYWLMRGKARLKHEIAQRTELDVRDLPYEGAFLEYLRDQFREARSDGWIGAREFPRQRRTSSGRVRSQSQLDRKS